MDEYLKVIVIKESDIVGKILFEVFFDDFNDFNVDGVNSVFVFL